MINISVCSCISYLLLFIIYKSMIMHFLLVSFIGFGDSHSSCASQASRPALLRWLRYWFIIICEKCLFFRHFVPSWILNSAPWIAVLKPEGCHKQIIKNIQIWIASTYRIYFQCLAITLTGLGWLGRWRMTGRARFVQQFPSLSGPHQTEPVPGHGGQPLWQTGYPDE